MAKKTTAPDERRFPPVRFSELFGDKNDLLVYSYMYGPGWQNPCPSCTSVIDAIDSASRHVRQQVELVVVGKARGADPRHGDLVWPLWGMLDMTHSGRHPDKRPQLHY